MFCAEAEMPPVAQQLVQRLCVCLRVPARRDFRVGMLIDTNGDDEDARNERGRCGRLQGGKQGQGVHGNGPSFFGGQSAVFLCLLALALRRVVLGEGGVSTAVVWLVFQRAFQPADANLLVALAQQ